MTKQVPLWYKIIVWPLLIPAALILLAGPLYASLLYLSFLWPLVIIFLIVHVVSKLPIFAKKFDV